MMFGFIKLVYVAVLSFQRRLVTQNVVGVVILLVIYLMEYVIKMKQKKLFLKVFNMITGIGLIAKNVIQTNNRIKINET